MISLVASIKFSRPDLRSVLPSPSATPSSPPPNPDAIPLNPAPGFLERMHLLYFMQKLKPGIGGVVPDVGELMLASFPSNTFEQTVAKSHPWYENDAMYGKLTVISGGLEKNMMEFGFVGTATETNCILFCILYCYIFF